MARSQRNDQQAKCADALLKKPITGSDDHCARAASGQDATTLPRKVMNSRHFMTDLFFRPNPLVALHRYCLDEARLEIQSGLSLL